MRGRYASYWNAFLFGVIFAENCIKMEKWTEKGAHVPRTSRFATVGA